MEQDHTQEKQSNLQSSSTDFSQSIPKIGLPKSGGAITGMGEKFSANPVTGTGSIIVPIATSAGRSGFGPELSLSYDSGFGNGPFGLGWSLSMPAINRKTDKGLPQYLDAVQSDVFLMSGTEDLVPLLNPDGNRYEDTTTDPDYIIHRYRPRIEGLFSRIERWTRKSDNDCHWRSLSNGNVLTIYGGDIHSRIVDPTNPERIFSWFICEVRDDKGNAVLYEYKHEDGSGIDISLTHERNRGSLNSALRSVNRYLKNIRYGNRTPLLDNTGQRPHFLSAAQRLNTPWMFEVVFDYGEHPTDTPTPNDSAAWGARPDPFSTYRPGFEVRTYRLCQRVLIFHHFPEEAGVGSNCLVRSTDFTYRYGQSVAEPDNPVNTTLLSITQCSYLRQGGNTYLKKALPPLEFDYSQVVLGSQVKSMASDSGENFPYGADGRNYQWLDLDGEGLSGVLTEQGGAWFYKKNKSPLTRSIEHGEDSYRAHLGASQAVATIPAGGLSSGINTRQFLDLDGNGQIDLVTFSAPLAGYYERSDGSDTSTASTSTTPTWKNFRAFKSLPTLDWEDPNLRFIDLSGDGHADILITQNEIFTWYSSLAEAGFDHAKQVSIPTDEELGPRVIFADAAETMFQADFSGDGLTDIVRIRNGEVCYWPNLGYGKFGPKISMGGAPWFDSPDQFDPARIRLIDIDGSGTIDMIYLGAKQTHCWFNQSGNTWGAAQHLAVIPAMDNITTVAAVDLLGNGTACLVWSTPAPDQAQAPVHYLELMSAGKPHLLLGSRNNLGAETQVRYAPSTYFYLKDQQKGKPWITRLPFPVHVVERVETYDHISKNRFVTRYVYHHGYFDGVEREFRGFGMVEQIDTQEYAALNNSDIFPSGSNIEQTSHVAPIVTRSWFHTGAYLGGPRISHLFKEEYYRQPGLSDDDFQRQLLSDTVIPPELTNGEEREAVRALKGFMLRQEVYALDGGEKQQHPYTVTEQNFTIKPLQSRGENRHAVFLVHTRESIAYHYERNPTDPRISHECILAVDNFGHILRSTNIGYGRQQTDANLSPADQQRQQQILITCSDSNYTNVIDQSHAYRLPLLYETRHYEVSGFTPPQGQRRFSIGALQALITSAAEIAYHAATTPALVQKRLLEQTRTLYQRDDLSGALALGQLEAMAIVFENYQLALTPEHMTLVYGNRVSATLMEQEGHFVHFGNDNNWWIPSGRTFFSDNPAHTAAEQLAQARAHFFFPRRFQEPFGESISVDYDTYDLLPIRTTDSLGNTTAAEHDYRLLQTFETTDINGNRSVAAFDVLGMVAGTAVMGKATETLGDSLTDFEAQLTQTQIDAFFADPKGPLALALLGNATSRIIYDENQFQSLGLPAVGATLVRETHVSDLAPGEQTVVRVSLAYSDGFGRNIQSKVQAEPGPLAEGVPDIIDPRWATSGWTIYNNKGNPVKQYEPFFSAQHAFEFGITVGVGATLFYDPIGRVVARLHPNHTWEKTVFDPWRQENWDLNDTVLIADPATDSVVGDYFSRLDTTQYLPTWHQARAAAGLGTDEQAAAQKAAAHANTPAVVHVDSLGRTFLSIADNGPQGRHATRTEQDIEGNSLRTIDARGNDIVSFQIEVAGGAHAPGYTMTGRKLYETNMDSGERWLLADISGKPIRTWDSRGHILRSTYDPLQRPQYLFVTLPGALEALAEVTVYGESHHNAPVHNLRGQVYQIYDGAGVVTSDQFDFKGNPKQGSRRLAREYRTVVDWSVLAGLSTVNDIETASVPLLEAQQFTTQTHYDALDRPVAITTPDNRVIHPGYNAANLLERMAVRLQPSDPTATHFIDNIDYNARGQRERVIYATIDGNNFTTSYQYDAHTFRLQQLRTQRHRDNQVLQDLHYVYDPVGNITSIRDHAQQTIFFNNTQVEPHNEYTYDALYQLSMAMGREHAVQNNLQRDGGEFDPLLGLPFANSPEALQRYVEEFTFDSVGNILTMAHSGGNIPRWTRRYQYANNSNRLLATSLPGDLDNQFSAPYSYDAHGNMTAMPHLPSMQWDYKNYLHTSSRQVVNAGTAETTYYIYDAKGERVRKVTERQAGAGATPTRLSERIYLGGFEVYRQYGANGTTVSLERETLYIMDDKQRIAQLDNRTQGNDDAPAQSQRFQLSNHLGSAVLEVDRQANLITCEEYHPYGSSAYRAGRSIGEVSLKRYRFAGGEKDEQTGLYRYGKRYCAVWLGRWTSADPIGIAGGQNLYQYAGNAPISLKDPNGTDPDDVNNPNQGGGGIKFGTQKENGKIKPAVSIGLGNGNADTPARRQSGRTGLGRKGQMAEFAFRAFMDVMVPNEGSNPATDVPLDQTPLGESERLDQQLERDKNKAPAPPKTKPKPGGGTPPPDPPSSSKPLSFGSAAADPHFELDNGDIVDDRYAKNRRPISWLPKPSGYKEPPMPKSQTNHIPSSVLVSPPIAEATPPQIKFNDTIGGKVLRTLDGLPDGASTLGKSIAGGLGKMSARFLIPFADEAMEAWETIGGSAGASYLSLRGASALRAGGSAIAGLGRGAITAVSGLVRGAAALGSGLGSTAGPLALAAAVGIGIGLLLDHFFNISSKIANWLSSITPEPLDALHGGRTDIRGMPGN